LLQCAPHEHVFNGIRGDTRTLHSVPDRVAAKTGCIGIIESAPVRFSDRGSGGRYDNCVTHGGDLLENGFVLIRLYACSSVT
jgi:hypothetical protein